MYFCLAVFEALPHPIKNQTPFMIAILNFHRVTVGLDVDNIGEKRGGRCGEGATVHFTHGDEYE